MSSFPLSPGVTINETNYDYYVRQVATSVAAMIGVTKRGPINTPVRVTSLEQFIRRFGTFTVNGYVAYAARDFFNNGGETLVVNRIAHYTDPSDKATLTALKSAITIPDSTGVRATYTTGTPASNGIIWTAKDTGTAGNDITITLAVSGASTPLGVTVVSKAITVAVATTSESAASSTVADIRAAISLSTAASALVTTAASGTGVVAASSVHNLAGGVTAGSALKFTAIDEGVWGDNLSVVIGSGTAATQFNATVYNGASVVSRYTNCSTDSTDARYIETLVNGVSTDLTVEDKTTQPATASNRPLNGTYALTAGSDGLTNLADADYTGDAALRTGLYALDAIADLNILAIPGVTSGGVLTDVVAYAESSKRAYPVLDSPLGLTPAEYLQFRAGQGEYTHTGFDTSFGALYWPWGEITDPLTNLAKNVPPSGAVMGCMARTDTKEQVWTAAAGPDNGRIFGWTGLEYYCSKLERDTLYPAGLNCIAVFESGAPEIVGCKTLQSAATATDRIPCRRTMMYLENAIGIASRIVTSKPSTPKTWAMLRRLVEPFLEGVKNGGGIIDYRFQCDEQTNPQEVRDQNRICSRVFVALVKPGDFVELDFVMVNSSANFTDLYTG